MPNPLTQLGAKSVLIDKQIANPRSILEVFDNPRPERDYQIQLTFPEFTSMCPVTGQPDFATITVCYVAYRHCVEMKSLKLYFFAYRNKGMFFEAVVNTILDDLVAAVKPRRMMVIGKFAVRGGTAATVTVEYEGPRKSKMCGNRGRQDFSRIYVGSIDPARSILRQEDKQRKEKMTFPVPSIRGEGQYISPAFLLCVFVSLVSRMEDGKLFPRRSTVAQVNFSGI